MMTFFAIILGAIVGTILMDERWMFGMIGGALVAYLLVAQARLRSELQQLRRAAGLAEPAEGAASVVEVEEDNREEMIEAYRAGMEQAAVEPGEAEPATTTMEKAPRRKAEAGETPSSESEARDHAADVVDRAVAAVREFFLGGNTAVRIGVIILFFGVAFLLKYAAEHTRFPIELRLAATAAGAIALLVFGWRQRSRRRGYALIIQGGAVGILYLTVFAALRLYSLLPPVMAFALLVGIVAFSATLAVLQNAMALAVLGAIGGFLAPILTSTGSGDHVALFSYFVVLNIGIIAIGWYKSWRPLNLVGFVFTFVLATMWGARYYTAAHFATTEPFLLIFFSMYLAVGVLFAVRQKPDLKGYVDGTLVFGTPLVSFGLQVKLVEPYEYGLAFTALGAGVVYVTLASIMFRRAPETLRALTEAFLALGVVFLSLAIPLALDGRWTAAAWAMEGAGILWVGLRQRRLLARLFGALLQAGAAVFFLREIGRPFGQLWILNGFYLGTLIIAIAALFSSWCLYRAKDRLRSGEEILGGVFLAWGALWWFGGGVSEIVRHIVSRYEFAALFTFISLSCGGFFLLARRLYWPPAAAVGIVLLPAMVLEAAVSLGVMRHPFADGGWWAWAVAFVTAYLLLGYGSRAFEQKPRFETFFGVNHTVVYWIGVALLTVEAAYWVDRWVGHVGVWADVVVAAVPAAMVLGVFASPLARRWPVSAYPKYSYAIATMPVIACLLAWILFANANFNGDASPLPYVPVLNPQDLTIVFALLTTVYWHLQSKKQLAAVWSVDRNRLAIGAMGGVIFLWSNGVLVRTLHHWAGVPYTAKAVFDSVLVQASLSVFWGLLGLWAMWSGTRMRNRPIWMAGAGLLAITVAKLFVVDLSNTGTIARIVSFIAVGLLLLAVGYLSPVPPKVNSKEKTA